MYGEIWKADFISQLKEYDNEEIFDFLQEWINWNKDRSPRTVVTLESQEEWPTQAHSRLLHSTQNKLGCGCFFEQNLQTFSLALKKVVISKEGIKDDLEIWKCYRLDLL